MPTDSKKDERVIDGAVIDYTGDNTDDKKDDGNAGMMMVIKM